MASARAGSPGGGSWRKVAVARDALLQFAVNVGKTTSLVIASRHAVDRTVSIDFVIFALCQRGTGEHRERLCRWVADAARERATLAHLRSARRLSQIAGSALRVGYVPQRVSSRRT